MLLQCTDHDLFVSMNRHNGQDLMAQDMQGISVHGDKNEVPWGPGILA